MATRFIWNLYRQIVASPGPHPLHHPSAVRGSRSRIPACSTTRVKSAIVFSLMIYSSGGLMQGTNKPWRRIDAKKGNHRPRRMGHD
jgi:hypothetical protein